MPFTVQEFFTVFNDYNMMVGRSIFPLYALAFVVLFLVSLRTRFSVLISVLFLSLMWTWMGVVYHGIFFSSINHMAWAFAIFFVLQGGLFIYAAWGKWISPVITSDNKRLYASAALFIYSLILYPLLGYLWGHPYPTGPIFGLPCPTTIFTFGLLLLYQGEWNRILALHLIPLLWSVVGTFAAFSFSILEDYALLLSALMAIYFLFQLRQESIYGPPIRADEA